MQLMTWTLARLGSRFNLLFEPHQRRLMHSALGRFLDRPLDLMVGLVEPDGTRRVLPFSQDGELLFNCEQNERFNSITFRGFSEKYRLRYELNFHSVFYPQDEALCTMPAFYVEVRLNPVSRVRWEAEAGPRPDKLRLFIRLGREDTQITARGGSGGDSEQLPRIDLRYRNAMRPHVAGIDPHDPTNEDFWHVDVSERIVSLNPEAQVDESGRGLVLELPVTEVGSGVKWRMVWGACCTDKVLEVQSGDTMLEGRFRYVRRWPDIEAVVRDAIDHRDERLAYSRRLEKLIDQAPLPASQRHLINQGFQSYLSNTFWCDLSDGEPWFSVWEGSCFFHSTVDVEYNASLLHLNFWPQLLALQLRRWAGFLRPHGDSGGAVLEHDIGWGPRGGKCAYPHPMPVEENANYLLLLSAYSRWTGDMGVARDHVAQIERLVRYLLWTDRDDSGFSSEGTANTIDDANAATQFSRKQTYLAIKRVAALRAADDLLARCDREALAAECRRVAAAAVPKIEAAAWLADHYAVCVDASAVGVRDAWTGQYLTESQFEGADAYSIYTANGLLLPLMTGQEPLFDVKRLRQDLLSAERETLSFYGCGHSSSEPENVWISQNVWRDLVAAYLDEAWAFTLSGHYWDMQVMSNTGAQSKGFIDTYINNNLCFYPRGATALGYLLAYPRLVVNRLAPGGPHVSVNPTRHMPQRWPLFALADWKARKIPVCVVDSAGRVTIEGETDPVVVRSESAARPSPSSSRPMGARGG